jgi:hypothetical protein
MSRLLAILIFIGSYETLKSQNLAGKWIGYFTPNSELNGNTYLYEINIAGGNNLQIKATTITKFSKQTSATAFAKGIYTPTTQLLNIQETKFDLLQLDPNIQACLMNNYLSYRNINGQDVLQGTYMAKNAVNGKDCGTGTVYLLKENPIVSVDPISKKIVIAKSKQSNNKISISKSTLNITSLKLDSNLMKGNSKTDTNVLAKNTISTNAQAVTAYNNIVTNAIITGNPRPTTIKGKEEMHEHDMIPWVLISRENNFVKKIITHTKNLSFDLYDNGTIDNDTITIYDNKKMLLDKNRLSYKPIHFDINFTDAQKLHEIIVVANNLGTVPPNTALLIYKDASQTEEILINTNLKTNAKLIIEYQPPSN